MGSSNAQTQAQTSSTQAPWSVQTPYLTQAFSGASNALGAAQGATAPTGFTAQYTPQQLAVFQQMVNSGAGNSGIPGSSAAAGSTLTGAGASGAAGGLYGLANFQNGGGTQSNIDAATQYANNPAIPGMVTAAMRDATNQANESTIPGINQQAAGSGNINSNRPQIAQGIVQRGLDSKAADISANLRGNAYTTGLGLAEQNSEANNTNALSALMGRVSGGTAATNAGVGANSGAVGQQGGLYDIANAGISGQNTAAQADLTNQGQAFNFNTNSPFQALQNFYNIIGANSWGGSSTGTNNSTTTKNPSILDMIGGSMNALGGFMGGSGGAAGAAKSLAAIP